MELINKLIAILVIFPFCFPFMPMTQALPLYFIIVWLGGHNMTCVYNNNVNRAKFEVTCCK